MSFVVAAASSDRLIGRYSEAVAPRFLEFAGVSRGPVLDVGCGPGSISAAAAAQFGPGAAVDPSPPFVAACAARVPGADVRVAGGEALPFEDRSFAAALSQLVLSFVRGPDRFVSEMVRVVQPGGVVAACTFEAGGFALVRTFWEAALALDSAAPHDDALPFRREPELVDLWTRGGLAEVEAGRLEVEASYTSFEDLWAPFSFGIGPAGGWLVAQSVERREAMRADCFARLGRPAGPSDARRMRRETASGGTGVGNSPGHGVANVGYAAARCRLMNSTRTPPSLPAPRRQPRRRRYRSSRIAARASVRASSIGCSCCCRSSRSCSSASCWRTGGTPEPAPAP